VPKVVIAGNWKMYKTQREALEFLQDFKSHLEETPDDREVVLCAPFTALAVLSKTLHGGRIRLGAQNVHWEKSGAYTGEISADMLTEIGVHYVVIGHSERRQYFGETDETVNLRVISAQKQGLIPIICVGESKAQRDAGETEKVIIKQIQGGLVNVDQKKPRYRLRTHLGDWHGGNLRKRGSEPRYRFDSTTIRQSRRNHSVRWFGKTR